MSSFYQEILNDPNNLPNLVVDNYYKDQVDIKSVIQKGKQFNFRNSYNTYNRANFFYQEQDDNQQYVLITGSAIDFTISKQSDQLIDQVKYLFSFQNLGTGNYSFYGNPIQLIEYVSIFIDNKEIQKVDTYQLNLLNLLNVRENAKTLKVQNLGLGVTTIAPNVKQTFMINLGTFLAGCLIHFQKIGEIKIRIKFYPDQTQNVQNIQLSKSFLVVETIQLTDGLNNFIVEKQKQLDYRYLKIDRKEYSLPSINANQKYRIKLTSNCLAAFILLQAQLTNSSALYIIIIYCLLQNKFIEDHFQQISISQTTKEMKYSQVILAKIKTTNQIQILKNHC